MLLPAKLIYRTCVSCHAFLFLFFMGASSVGCGNRAFSDLFKKATSDSSTNPSTQTDSDGSGDSSGDDSAPVACGDGCIQKDLTVSSNRLKYNVHDAAVAAGWDGVAPLNANITISSGVVIYSDNVATPAFSTGALPVGSSVTLNNSGKIYGAAISNAAAADKTGTLQAWEGGTAIQIDAPFHLINSGTITGGSGGAGGGDGDRCCSGANGPSTGGQGGSAIVLNAIALITNTGEIFGAGGGGAGGAGAWMAAIGSGWGGVGQGAYNGDLLSVGLGKTTGICSGGQGGNGGSYGQAGVQGGSCWDGRALPVTGYQGAIVNYVGPASGGAGGYALVLNGKSVTLNGSTVVANPSYTENTWISGTKGRIAP